MPTLVSCFFPLPVINDEIDGSMTDNTRILFPFLFGGGGGREEAEIFFLCMSLPNVYMVTIKFVLYDGIQWMIIG